MNDEELQLAAEGQVEETSEAPDMDALMGTEQPEEEATVEPNPEPEVDAEKEALKAQVKLEQDKRNGVKADKNLLGSTLKKVLDEYGIDYEEAAKHAGISPNDLKARVENLETSDNPVAAFSAQFDDLYVNKGNKAVLDDVYGTDTQAYVNAFAKYGFSDPELQAEALSLEPAKALNFVVKHGKELLEEMGGADVSARKLAKELAAAKAELAALKGGKVTEPTVQTKPKQLPISGPAGISAVSKPKDGVESLFYS